MNVIYSKSLIP